jgi:creatinine amidohydrolase
MDWQLLSTDEHKERRFEAALLPVGTIEAHGRGGPIGTDNLIPEAICRITQSLLGYPGGVTLNRELLEGFLWEVGRSLKRHGVKYLFVMNGHGGNTEALRDAALRLFSEADLNTAVIDWWTAVESDARAIFGEEGMGHAAIDEMGALLGFHPELRAGLPAGEVPSFHFDKGVRAYPVPRPVITYTRLGEKVDFARLTPEKCAQFAERVVDAMAASITGILEGWKDAGR